MIVERAATPDVLLITPCRFLDHKGFFSETGNRPRSIEADTPGPFVKDNHTHSMCCGVVRRLHLQIGPDAAPREAFLSARTRILPRLAA